MHAEQLGASPPPVFCRSGGKPSPDFENSRRWDDLSRWIRWRNRETGGAQPVVAVRMMKQPLIALTDIIFVAEGEDATER